MAAHEEMWGGGGDPGTMWGGQGMARFIVTCGVISSLYALTNGGEGAAWKQGGSGLERVFGCRARRTCYPYPVL